MSDLRSRVLDADDRPREQVEVPWDVGEPLYVRALSIADYRRFLNAQEDIELTPKLMTEIVCETLVTADGERILKPSDAPKLGEKNAQVITALANTAMRLSGLLDDEPDPTPAQSEPSSTG